MRERVSIQSVLLRILLLFIVLPALFLYFDPIGSFKKEADTFNALIFGLYVPIVFTIIYVLISLIAAIPFWFFPALYRWWRSKQLLQVLILFVGLGLLFLFAGEQKERSLLQYEMAECLKSFGWFITCVSILIIDISDFLDKVHRKMMKSGDWTQMPNR